MSQQNAQQVTIAAAQLRDSILSGEVDESHPHAGLVDDREVRSLLNFLATAYDPDAEYLDHNEDLPEDVTDTALWQRIVANESTHALTEAVRSGNISVMQYGVGRVDHSKDATDASTQAWLRNNLLTEAYVGWITGGMGSGKTDFALDRADDWHYATRGRVATNIESAADRNDFIEFIDNYADLESFFKDSSGHVLFLLDETDQRLSAKGGNGAYADALANTLKLVRKGENGSEGTKRGLLLIGQTIRGAGKELRRLVTSNGHLYHKTDKRTVEIYDDVVSGELSRKSPEKTIRGVEKTRLGFKTGDESDFDMSGALDGEDGEDGLSPKDRDKRTAIRAVARQGLTYRQAADLIDFAKDWVGERVREWKQGDHRELVGFGPEDAESQTTDG